MKKKMDDSLNFYKGIIFGLIFVLPFWLAALYLIAKNL